MVLARDVVGFETRGPVHAVLLDGSGEIEARAVIVATGVSYRRLEATGLDELTGRGVYYGASASEASQCEGDDVYIVGAANSAGQAALNLARYAKRVVLVVRGASARGHRCRSTWSSGSRPRPTSRCGYRSEVVACRGDGHLEALTLRRPRHRRRRGGADELAVRLHRRLAAHRLARRRRRSATTRASSSPARTCVGAARPRRGRCRARRSRSRRACPGCSRPATSGSTR